jgi:aryl-alcohol dehydrogenase-like predicted oxidoreductase
MERREIGRSGLVVSAIGLGCMGMSQFYGPADEAESIRTLHRALELGVTLLDTADVYGQGENERLVGKALKGRREQAIIATKFGIVRRDDGTVTFDGRPEYVRRACEASLERLGIDVIDLYQCHRVDPAVPIEETVGTMHELVAEGNVRFIGLSEAHPEDIRRASAVAPVATLQSEYSLFERSVEREILDTCEELGIGLLPFSPLGRGVLTGRIERSSQFGDGDFRRSLPRYQDENLEQNLSLVAAASAIAADKGCTPGQLALAWLLSRRPWIVPIPGTKRVLYLEENAAAATISLSPDDLARLEGAIPPEAVAGERYPPELMPSWTSAPRRA